MSLNKAAKGVQRIQLLRINPASRVPMPWIMRPNEPIRGPHLKGKVTLPQMFIGNNIQAVLQQDLPVPVHLKDITVMAYIEGTTELSPYLAVNFDESRFVHPLLQFEKPYRLDYDVHNFFDVSTNPLDHIYLQYIIAQPEMDEKLDKKIKLLINDYITAADIIDKQKEADAYKTRRQHARQIIGTLTPEQLQWILQMVNQPPAAKQHKIDELKGVKKQRKIKDKGITYVPTSVPTNNINNVNFSQNNANNANNNQNYINNADLNQNYNENENDTEIEDEDIDMTQQQYENEMMETAANVVPPVKLPVDQPLAQPNIIYDDKTGLPVGTNPNDIPPELDNNPYRVPPGLSKINNNAEGQTSAASPINTDNIPSPNVPTQSNNNNSNNPENPQNNRDEDMQINNINEPPVHHQFVPNKETPIPGNQPINVTTTKNVHVIQPSNSTVNVVSKEGTGVTQKTTKITNTTQNNRKKSTGLSSKNGKNAKRRQKQINKNVKIIHQQSTNNADKIQEIQKNAHEMQRQLLQQQEDSLLEQQQAYTQRLVQQKRHNELKQKQQEQSIIEEQQHSLIQQQKQQIQQLKQQLEQNNLLLQQQQQVQQTNQTQIQQLQQTQQTQNTQQVQQAQQSGQRQYYQSPVPTNTTYNNPQTDEQLAAEIANVMNNSAMPPRYQTSMPAQRGSLVKTPIQPGVQPQLRNVNKYNQDFAADPTMDNNLSQQQVQQVQQYVQPYGYTINQPRPAQIGVQQPTQVLGSILHPAPTFTTRMIYIYIYIYI